MVYSGKVFTRGRLRGSEDKSNVFVNLIAKKYSSLRSKHLYFRQIKRLFADNFYKRSRKEDLATAPPNIVFMHTRNFARFYNVFHCQCFKCCIALFSKYLFATLYILGQCSCFLRMTHSRFVRLDLYLKILFQSQNRKTFCIYFILASGEKLL